VVVDHVQHHGEAAGVAGGDQALQALRTAVRALDREGQHAVIAPVASPRELRDRHDLHRRDPQVAQAVQMRDDRVKGAFGREGPDVQLVEDVVLEREAAPAPLR
jgi:hypothetical protein